MWFRLAKATFNVNLGTMESISKSYRIDYALTGLDGSHTSTAFETEGQSISVTFTFTVRAGYEFKSGSTITCAGTTIFTAGQDYAAGATFSATTNINNTVEIAGTASAVSVVPPDDGGDEPTSGGTLITSGSLAGAYLYENSQFDGQSTTIIPDTSNTYFIIEAIPVEGNTEYILARGRACWFLNSNKTPIEPTANKYVNLTSGYTNFTFTTPATCAYITVAFKYVDIQPAHVRLIKNSFGEPTTTLLKDTGATYMAETAIVAKGTNPSTYTEPQPYTGFFTYHLIPVTGNSKYKMENCRLSNWYDSSKNFISQVNFNINSTNATTSDWSHVAPENAAYLSLCVKVGDIDKDSVAMVEYLAI